jgi:benzil reductase ((S)-benzoin forming)
MKTIVMTGTSSGLGKAFFERFAGQEDVRVVSLSRRFLPEQQQIAAESGGRVRLVQVDLNRVSELPTAADFAGWLDGAEEVVFLNNAAIVEPIEAVGRLDKAKVIESVQVNVTAAMLLTNALFGVPGIVDKQVKVLNISSGAAKRTIEGWAVYCAAKAGNEMFFDVLKADYASYPNIQVHNVNPGVMDTQMQGKIRESEFPTKQRFVDLHTEGKLPTPESVAERIVREYL